MQGPLFIVRGTGFPNPQTLDHLLQEAMVKGQGLGGEGWGEEADDEEEDGAWGLGFRVSLALRVQVPNYHILTQNLYYNYYYPNPQVPNYWVLGP